MVVVYALTVPIILLALIHDEAVGFRMGAWWQYSLFLALVILLTGGLLRRRKAGAGLLRRLILLGLALAFLLSMVGLASQLARRSLLGQWSRSRAQRLETAGRDIRAEFTRFLSRLSEAPAEWKNDQPDPDRLGRFSKLQALAAVPREAADRYGWTLLRGGNPDAWAGRTTAAEAPGGSGAHVGYRIVRRGAAIILMAGRKLSEEYTLQGEFLLQSPLEKQPYLPLSALSEARNDERVSVLLLSTSEAIAGATRSFDSRAGGERLDEPAGGPALLSFPLREPGGTPLAVVRIQDRREDLVEETILHRCQAAGLALSLLFLLSGAALALRGSFAPRLSGCCWFLTFLAFLAAARLLLLGFPGLSHDIPAFAPDRFACGTAWQLLKSPADFFLSALLCALCVQGGALWLSRREISTPWRPRAGLALVPVAAFLVAFAARLAWEAPRDARFEVLKVEFTPPDWEKILVQAGLYLFSASAVALLMAAVRLLRGNRAHPLLPAASGSPPAATRAYALVALATLIYLPVVSLSTTRQREHFFSEKLVRRVELHQQERRDALKAILRSIHDSPEVGEVLEGYGSESGEGLAYEVWAASHLQEAGFSSSLRVFSGAGRPLGRFGLNLPSRWDARFPPSGDEGAIRVSLTPAGNFRRRILVGEASRSLPDGETFRFQVHLLDDYENLPFMRSDNLYVQLFPGPRTQETNPELLGSEPLVAVFDPTGRSLYASVEGGVDLPPSARWLAPGDSAWTNLRTEENSYRVLFRRLPDRLVAVGFLLPSALEQTGALVRSTILGSLAAMALALLFRFLGGPSPRAARRQGPFFRRLVAMILAASLIPVLLLSFFLHRFLLREINEDLSTEGLASLGAARRIVKDYLTSRPGAEEPKVDDDVAFWLSQVVRQDINLFSGDRLSATSAREIYASGLLSTRLDARVYEKLVLLGEAYALSPAGMGRLRYQTISALVSPGDPSPGILSLPLAEKKQEILHKRADVEEAILIVTVGMLVLLTLLARFLARRVSDPIVALSAAARRIEAGDYDAEVRVSARDEPALLIDSFNRMAASLRRQREDLRRRSDYIEKILLNATTGVISIDPEGRLVTINPAARMLLGLEGAGFEGTPFAKLLERSASLAPLRAALSGTRAEREKTWQIAMAGDRPEASLRVVSLPFRETADSPAGRILLLEDLTEAVRSSRLEAWAEMARRIAHEIKNPLTPIQLSVDHLRKVRRSADPRLDAILDDCLDTIHKQVQNLRHIAREFSEYARIPQIRLERIPVAELLGDVLTPLRAAPPEGIRVESSVAPGTPDLLVDRELLRRALTNLVQNALEAMPRGGLLAVTAQGQASFPAGNSSGVRIVVSDSGEGMDDQTLSRLFEPYFSTKESGTGLGLSIVRKTVEDQGGRVSVRSSPGAGTRVILELPAAGEAAPEAGKERSGAESGI
jgi:signal transduction histidine kinase/HAMP domain-containing protein